MAAHQRFLQESPNSLRLHVVPEVNAPLTLAGGRFLGSQRPIKSIPPGQDWGQRFCLCVCVHGSVSISGPKRWGHSLVINPSQIAPLNVLYLLVRFRSLDKGLWWICFAPKNLLSPLCSFFAFYESRQQTNWCIKTAWSLKWREAGSTVPKVHED